MPARKDDLVHLVARRIAEMRVQNGLTQEALATRLDIATKNMQRLESGRQNLTLRTIERVADALAVDRKALLPGVVERRGDARSALSQLVDAGFTIVPASQPKQRPPHSIPVVDLHAAAGLLGGDPRSVDVLGWTVLRRRAPPPSGCFAARIRGESMAPRIPDGSVCLFGPAESRLEGRIALLAQGDADIGGAYSIKKISKVTRTRDGVTHVVLRSFNPSFPPVTVHTTAEDELRVVAEFLEILARS